MTDQDFNDIAPFADKDFHENVVRLVEKPQFKHAVQWALPHVNYDDFAAKLKSVDSQESFQMQIMCPFLENLEKTTSKGITCGGAENYRKGTSYTLISNHRDIVLDASFLNLCLVRAGLPTCEVAIGNNLLIMPWIDTLVRLNKSFIVKRNTGVREALEAAKHLSAYIHYAISQKHQSLWIAHREGRAKDSNDRTQESLIKMLALGGQSGNLLDNLKEINLMPVSISYEYDPNDYLKVREFLLKQRDPDFKKSPHDDLLSMETGIMQQKGHIHFELTECINPKIDALPCDLEKGHAAARVCHIIDEQIHGNYRLYPINYVAYDLLEETERFADQYTAADVDSVRERLEKQLARVDVPDITPDEMNYMRRMMLTMYANPLRNKLKI